MKDAFRALLVEKDEGRFSCSFQELTAADLPQGELLLRIAYSGVNYKDALASIPNGNVARSYPLVPGIDLAGVVVQSSDPRVGVGRQVLATGYDLGVSHHGGYAEFARIPAQWAVPLPDGLSLRQAMGIGTAGFTAALAIDRLEGNGLTPASGPVLVTGASGGVGSIAVDMLAARGYEVHASTGKESAREFLQALGAAEVLRRAEVAPEKVRPLDKQRWAGVVDPVGGQTLSYAISSLRQDGAVALIGLTGGAGFETTVFPFILRGCALFGVESGYVPASKRPRIWERIAGDLRSPHLESLIVREVAFDALPSVLRDILQGSVQGRVVVRIAGE